MATGKVINNIVRDGVSYAKGDTIEADKEVIAHLIEAGAVADPKAKAEEASSVDTSAAEAIIKDATEKAAKLVDKAKEDADKIREDAGKDAEASAVKARGDADAVKAEAQKAADQLKG